MNPHFFTAPFYFAFIWFRVQGSRFKVQGYGGAAHKNIEAPQSINRAMPKSRI